MEEDDDNVEKFLEKVVVLKRKVEEQGEIISDNTFMGVLARLPKEYDTILSILDATENLTPDSMINTILETYRKKKKEELENSAKALTTVHQDPQIQPQQPQQPQQNQGRGREVIVEVIVVIVVVDAVVAVVGVDEVDVVLTVK
jgi:hypothetical protein